MNLLHMERESFDVIKNYVSGFGQVSFDDLNYETYKNDIHICGHSVLGFYYGLD